MPHMITIRFFLDIRRFPLRFLLTPIVSIALFATSTVLPFFEREASSEERASTLYVEIASTKVRKEPKHWAQGVANVVYGDPLTVIESNSGWLKVRTPSGVEGFIHSSAVTERKVALAPGSTKVQIRADDSDIVLAGKGFSEQIEDADRDQNKELPYQEVDRLLKLAPSDEQIGTFVESGKLRNG